MRSITSTLTLSAVLLSAGLHAPTPADTTQNAQYRIDFLGKNPTDDWVLVASKLLDAGVAPIGTLTMTTPGAGLCHSVMEVLNFPEAGLKCSAAMDGLLKKMNPGLAKVAALGSTARYPDLPLESFTWTLLFDTSNSLDSIRHRSITTIWRKFQIEEKSRGPQVNTILKGFRTRLAVPPTSEGTGLMRSLQRYDETLKRLDVRVVRVDDSPIADSPQSVAHPPGWYERCTRNGGASPPKPSYATLLGLAKMPDCVAACAQRGDCPEIILVDKEVKPHRDIAKAIGTINGNAPPGLCPHADWDDEFHGTHLAGIMVSEASATSFGGLAPEAVLESKAYDKMKVEELDDLIQERGTSYTRKVIFVFASKFKVDRPAENLSDPVLRRVTPSHVASIIDNDKLWIVAAGNGDPGTHISNVSRLSPMNLGDLPNVLVVTACENCLTDRATLASWANYSKDRLVNVAAPGGTPSQRIPAPATETHYTAHYGTSQAAAMVGGLAAAMLSCYPEMYSSSIRLKLRIQASARPPLQPEVAEKLAAGYVDAEMALRNPTVHWISLLNGDGPKEATELQWCRQRVLLASRGVLEGVFTKRIRQIARHQDGTSTFVYEPDKPGGLVMRTRPGKLDEDLPLLRVTYKDGTESPPLKLDQIENLLVGFETRQTKISLRPERCK